MKTLMIIAFSILTMNIKAQDISKNKVGPKGGELKLVQNYNIEMINSIEYVSVYVYDKNLNPISNNGILCEIVFCFASTECWNRQFNPNGKFGLIANVTNADYDYCDINLIINGKPIAARFTNVSGLIGNDAKK